MWFESTDRVMGDNINLLSDVVKLFSRPLKNAPFCPISVSGSGSDPRNTRSIPVVEILALLDLEQKRTFFKGLFFLGGIKVSFLLDFTPSIQ